MESYSLPPTDNCIPVLILFRRESGCGHLSALIPFPLLATIAHEASHVPHSITFLLKERKVKKKIKK